MVAFHAVWRPTQRLQPTCIVGNRCEPQIIWRLLLTVGDWASALMVHVMHRFNLANVQVIGAQAKVDCGNSHFCAKLASQGGPRFEIALMLCRPRV